MTDSPSEFSINEEALRRTELAQTKELNDTEHGRISVPIGNLHNLFGVIPNSDGLTVAADATNGFFKLDFDPSAINRALSHRGAAVARAEDRFSGSSKPPERVAATALFARSGQFWTIGYDGNTFQLKDLKGLSYIQRLLRHPGEEFHSLDLLSEPEPIDAPDDSRIERGSSSLPTGVSLQRGLVGDAGELLDNQAVRSYRRRLLEIREELGEIREKGDVARAEEMESEAEFITRELARAVGLGGRNRRAGSAAERARLNITRAIKAAIQKISEFHPTLAELLNRSSAQALTALALRTLHHR